MEDTPRPEGQWHRVVDPQHEWHEFKTLLERLMDEGASAEPMADFALKRQSASVTWVHLGLVLAFLRSMNTRNRQRNRRLERIEAALGITDADTDDDISDTVRQHLRSAEQSPTDRPTAAFRGVWSDTVSYTPGDLVLRANGLWHCRRWHQGRMPGHDEGREFWQVVVRASR